MIKFNSNFAGASSVANIGGRGAYCVIPTYTKLGLKYSRTNNFYLQGRSLKGEQQDNAG